MSFDKLELTELGEICCFLGRNNTGKSNVFKLLRFFYSSMEGKRSLPPELNSNYSEFGYIELTFDTTHISKIVNTPRNSKNQYFQHVKKTLLKQENESRSIKKNSLRKLQKKVPVRLYITNRGDYYFEKYDKSALRIINDLFPLFGIDARRIDLHNWDNLWDYLGSLRPFNANQFESEFKKFLKKNENLKEYSRNISLVNELSQTERYSYREKLKNFIKAGLKGERFMVDGNDLIRTSDGSNSYSYIVTVLRLVGYLTRYSYQTPLIFIDEPELGLHPKLAEKLINDYELIVHSNYYDDKGAEKSSSRPSLYLSTHSPNIVKQVIKSFRSSHNIFHFSTGKGFCTTVNTAKSRIEDSNLAGNFTDNEARLFFSSYILFVEGETEVEYFNCQPLIKKFPHLLEVDVYHAPNNKKNKVINPDFVNTKVPHLFLYDADKAITASLDRNRNVKFKNKGDGLAGFSNKELTQLKVSNNRKFDQSRHYVRSDIMNFETELTRNYQTKYYSEELVVKNQFKKIVKSLNYLVRRKNRFYIAGTFENALINVRTKDLFLSWLRDEVNFDLFPWIKRLRKSNKFTENDLILLLCLCFGGKTECLRKFKGDKGFRKRFEGTILFGVISRFKSSLDRKLQESGVSSDKTSGWVSSYTEYSIRKIEAECRETGADFYDKFRVYFGELNDIIKKLR